MLDKSGLENSLVLAFYAPWSRWHALFVGTTGYAAFVFSHSIVKTLFIPFHAHRQKHVICWRSNIFVISTYHNSYSVHAQLLHSTRSKKSVQYDTNVPRLFQPLVLFQSVYPLRAFLKKKERFLWQKKKKKSLKKSCVSFDLFWI